MALHSDLLSGPPMPIPDGPDHDVVASCNVFAAIELERQKPTWTDKREAETLSARAAQLALLCEERAATPIGWMARARALAVFLSPEDCRRLGWGGQMLTALLRDMLRLPVDDPEGAQPASEDDIPPPGAGDADPAPEIPLYDRVPRTLGEWLEQAVAEFRLLRALEASQQVNRASVEELWRTDLEDCCDNLKDWMIFIDKFEPILKAVRAEALRHVVNGLRAQGSPTSVTLPVAELRRAHLRLVVCNPGH